jgi:hypothetical protein
VLGWSPVKAGLAFTPVAVTAMIGNGAGAKLTARIGPRVPMLAGMAVMAGSFALLTTVSVRTGFTVPPCWWQRWRSACSAWARAWPCLPR